MTIYFQHVGERLGQRDFPKTLGTKSSGLKLFAFSDVEPFLSHIEPHELEEIRLRIRDFAPNGFQIWGIPTGAKIVLRNLTPGDHLLLLETPGPGGQFVYAGVVIAHPSKECFDLSQHLWGEQRFAIIVFLKGTLIDLPWPEFCQIFGYKENWNPAGQTYRIGSDRLEHAGLDDEIAAIIRLTGGSLELVDPTYSVADDAGDGYLAEEGSPYLARHLQRERSATLVARFKRRLHDLSCCICGFNFERAYGDKGKGFIEAHHVKPVSELTQGDTTSIDDLVPVCSNCHRILHRNYPALGWQNLKEVVAQCFFERVQG